MKKKLIVAVTGASGALYAKSLFDRLTILKEQWDEVGVIFSKTGKEVWNFELPGVNTDTYPFQFYKQDDLFAAPASGSARFDSMIICPCSGGTMGRIAHGTGENLVTRAADVMLKERRKLILLLRESPLSLVHIRNMEILSLSGAIIYPASPGFYGKPETISELINPLTDRLLEQAGFEIPSMYRWRGN